MRLTDLEPQFVRYETRIEPYNVVDGDPMTWQERGQPTRQVTGPREYLIHVPTFQEAQGIMFLCPKCYQANQGPVGTHRCLVTFDGRGVLPSQGQHGRQREPVRWAVSGTGYSDLTTYPSILLIGGCGWHGFITQGEVSILPS